MAGTMWKQSQYKFDMLSKRERFLFLLTLCVAIIAGWYHYVLLPFTLSMVQMENRLTSLHKHQSPAVNRDELERIGWQELEKVVPVEKMAGLVTLLMPSDGEVEMLVLKAKPAIKQQYCEQGLNQYGSKPIFRHDIKLSLVGDYPGILNYVYKLENLSWRVNSDTFELKVVSSAQSTIQWHLHIFSFSRSFFNH